MTSTFPANSKVRAFFHEMIRKGSEEAFNSSVAFITKLIFQIGQGFVKAFSPLKPLSALVFTDLLQCCNESQGRSPPGHLEGDGLLHCRLQWRCGQLLPRSCRASGTGFEVIGCDGRESELSGASAEYCPGSGPSVRFSA